MKNSFVRRTFAVLLSVLMLVGMIPVHGVEAENNTTIDCVIISAEDIAVAGNPGDIAGVGTVKTIVNKGLTEDGMVRFGVSDVAAGKETATTSHRFAVAIDNRLSLCKNGL